MRDEAGISAAVELVRGGKLTEAVTALERIAAEEPDWARAHQNLGAALADSGKLDDAAKSFRRAIELDADYYEAHLNLANTLLGLNRREEAAREYGRAIGLRPTAPEGLHGLGKALSELKRWDEAAVYLEQALRLRPDAVETLNSLGMARAELGQWKQAEEAYDRALRLDPKYVEAHTNLGSCYAHQGRLLEALAQYDLALWLKPDAVSTHWNRSLSLLHLGNYEQGFREYEWRWKRTKSPMRALPTPMWDGGALDGKTILLWAEQGLGDTLQFIRYAPLVKARGGRVLLECPAPLREALKGCGGVDEMVAQGGDLPPHDVHAPLLSLPRLFGTTMASLPRTSPYLFPDPARVDTWRRRLACLRSPAADLKPQAASLKPLLVGLAWQGNPHHQWDRHRSIRLAALGPLARVPGVRLVSLQRGPGADQADALRQTISLDLLLDPAWDDARAWAEVAAIVANLDLVVTVDTATAHLAGALAAPTWLLLSKLCDWRWLIAREDTPWYPTMRLCRQEDMGQWRPVVARVVRDLLAMAQRPQASGRPEAR